MLLAAPVLVLGGMILQSYIPLPISLQLIPINTTKLAMSFRAVVARQTKVAMRAPAVSS